jgi:hypothetical protein
VLFTGDILISPLSTGHARLPELHGHKDIVSTLVYLNITPDLLQQASERYRQRGAVALGASGGRS